MLTFKEHSEKTKKEYLDKVLSAMNNMATHNKRLSIYGIAFDILRQHKLDMTPRDLAKKYSSVYEDMMTTGSVPGAGDDNSTVVVKKKKRFDVPHHIFRRFVGKKRMKFERWSNYLSSNSLYEDVILNYIKENRGHDVILRSQVSLEEVTITID